MIFLGAAVSRGALQLVVSQVAAYGLQFALVSLSVLLLIACGGPRRRKGAESNVIVHFAVISIAASCLVTASIRGQGGLLYACVMVFYIALFWIFSSYQFEHIRYWVNFKSLAVCALALVVVGVGQAYLGLFSVFSGSDFYSVAGHLRPASLTGSYLHYPLALSALFFPMIQYSQRRRLTASSMWILAGLALLLSLSRSGLFILLAGFFIWAAIRRSWGILATITFSVTVVALLRGNWAQNVYVARILGAGSLSATGNLNRVTVWSQGLNMWLHTHLLIGEYTGIVTNAASDLGNTSGLVVESGVLQQLLNFGLIGAVLFYVVILSGSLRVDRRHKWLIAGLFAAAAESVFYQSIEVFPFMVILAIYPAVSDSIRVPGPMARGDRHSVLKRQLAAGRNAGGT
jgi:hypothetical protein